MNGGKHTADATTTATRTDLAAGPADDTRTRPVHPVRRARRGGVRHRVSLRSARGRRDAHGLADARAWRDVPGRREREREVDAGGGHGRGGRAQPGGRVAVVRVRHPVERVRARVSAAARPGAGPRADLLLPAGRVLLQRRHRDGAARRGAGAGGPAASGVRRHLPARALARPASSTCSSMGSGRAGSTCSTSRRPRFHPGLHGRADPDPRPGPAGLAVRDRHPLPRSARGTRRTHPRDRRGRRDPAGSSTTPYRCAPPVGSWPTPPLRCVRC